MFGARYQLVRFEVAKQRNNRFQVPVRDAFHNALTVNSMKTAFIAGKLDCIGQ